MSHVDESLIAAFLDGELPAEREAALVDHLEGCGRCAALLEEAAAVHAAGSRVLEQARDEAEGPAWETLVARAGAAPSAAMPADPGSRSFLVPGLAWAATLVLAFALGWQASHSSELTAPAAAPAFERAAPTAEPPAVAEEPATAAVQEAVADAKRLPAAEARQARPSAQRPAGSAPEREVAAEPEAPPPPQAAPERMFAALAAPPAEAPRGTAEALFRRITPSEAASLLGAEPLRLPDADLRSAEIGSGELAGPDGSPGRGRSPILRLVYDETGGEARIIVEQQLLVPALGDAFVFDAQGSSDPAAQPRAERAGDAGSRRDASSLPAAGSGPESAVATIGADGQVVLTWLDRRGYLVRIRAPLPEPRLRELAASLR